MNFISMFRASARELKSLRCLTTTGVLIAVYVILNTFVAVNTASLKITFGYLSLAAIGVLYGPVVSVLAAIPCDIITALSAGLGLNFIITPIKMLEGFIYGILLYGLRFWGGRSRLNAELIIKIIAARALAVMLCYLTFNTLVLYYIFDASKDSFFAYFILKLTKNLLQFPVDIILMLSILPVVRLVYNRG